MEKKLIVKHLTVKYEEKLAVKDVSFSLNSGKIYVLVGESGSGKTTLLRSIGGILPKEGKIISGDICLDEKDLVNISEKEWEKIHGSSIGYIFQNPEQSLSPLTKIEKQFLECARAHETIERKDKKQILSEVQKMLSKLCFTDPKRVLKSYPFELSGGMCQRVAIALAIMNRPILLLADEPTSALDTVSQKMTIETLLTLKEKKKITMLIVTHNMEVACKLADEIGVMYKGKIIESGLPEEILKNPKETYTKKLIAAIPEIITRQREEKYN